MPSAHAAAWGELLCAAGHVQVKMHRTKAVLSEGVRDCETLHACLNVCAKEMAMEMVSVSSSLVEEKGSLIPSETVQQKLTWEGSQQTPSGVLCFDLLPLLRSSHLSVIVYQAATLLLSPAILVCVSLNCIL